MIYLYIPGRMTIWGWSYPHVHIDKVDVVPWPEVRRQVMLLEFRSGQTKRRNLAIS